MNHDSEEKKSAKGGMSSFETAFFYFDTVLFCVSALSLIASLFRVFPSAIMTIILAIITVINLLPILISALRSLFYRKITINLLASIALIFAVFNREWHSAVFIGLMLVSARIFMMYTETRARRAIKSLLKLRPSKAHLKIDGRVVDIETEKLKVGDLVLVEVGERVPVDGIVESGQCSIDQSSLTGESEPVAKNEGDQVFSSTLVVAGSLTVRAKKVGEDTTFSKIIDLVEESQSAKAPIGSMAEKFASWYIVATIICALTIYFFSGNLTLILSILLVTCADDLAVAVPLSFIAGINAAAKKGIIVKGGIFIEGFSKIKAFIFDKTGTITTGKPKIQTIKSFNHYSEKEFLSLLAGLENESEHPSARAIIKFIEEKNIKIPPVSDFYEEPGYGSRGFINGKYLFSGKIKFLEKNNVKFSEEQYAILQKEKEFGHSLTVLGAEGEAVGFISFSDTLRPHAHEVIDKLKKLGAERIIMLTGDNEKVAGQIAKEIHIPEFKANLLPEDKIEFLKATIKPDYKVAMIGDGVNDAPSLSLADVGIAMGAIGTDAAIESADIVLMKDKLVNILEMAEVSRYTMKIIRQDFWLWGITNAIGLGLVFAGVIGPSEAAAYNFLTDFLPLLNSLRLFRIKFPQNL